MIVIVHIVYNCQWKTRNIFDLTMNFIVVHVGWSWLLAAAEEWYLLIMVPSQTWKYDICDTRTHLATSVNQPTCVRVMKLTPPGYVDELGTKIALILRIDQAEQCNSVGNQCSRLLKRLSIGSGVTQWCGQCNHQKAGCHPQELPAKLSSTKDYY